MKVVKSLIEMKQEAFELRKLADRKWDKGDKPGSAYYHNMAAQLEQEIAASETKSPKYSECGVKVEAKDL